MTSKCILRVEKHSSFEKIDAMNRHVNRKTIGRNIVTSKTKYNRIVQGQADVRVSTEERLKQLGITKLRKNGVILLEFVTTFSPNYLLNENGEYIEAAGQRLADFIAQTKQWFAEEFGSNVVSAVLHMDETTPHIHTFVVPAYYDNKGRAKLSARKITGSKQLLSKMQDSFAKKMSPLGLSRGERGSKASHTKLADYHKAVNAAHELAHKVNSTCIKKCEVPKQPEEFNPWLTKIDSMIKSVTEILRIDKLKSLLRELVQQNRTLIAENNKLKAKLGFNSDNSESTNVQFLSRKANKIV
jgi:hypothetical protein